MKLKMDYKWVALLVTAVGTFMANFDSTIVVIGLPTILNDLHSSIVHGIWIITGYTHDDDTFGSAWAIGRFIRACPALQPGVCYFHRRFAVLCFIPQRGATDHFPVPPGRGAALLYANSGAIITDAFPKGELGMGLGINIMAVNLGAITGYTLGGVIITYFGWRSIFLLNLPIGIIGTVLGYMNLKEIGKKPIGPKI